MWWALWWVWMIGAVVLGIVEIFAPTQIILGFAIGAAGVGLALLFGAPGLAGSLPLLILVFGVISLVAWLLLRPMMGVRRGQVKHFEHDINED
jgi:membrane protein implicated in regulation of membrane protease activity